MIKIYQSTSNGAIEDPDESPQSQQSSSRWSLISLCNNQGQNIELKFVDKMKRQFQFSVDAFQIHLNSLLSYYDCRDTTNVHSNMTENIYPTVIAESMYGEFAVASYHLNSKLIATKSPEEIRGGGLLKYCNLLIKGYKPICVEQQMNSMEKYMCSRFFIDFSDLSDQEHKLNTYMDCHFQNAPHMCVTYLEKLFDVVDSSTVCLMGHERKQTLNLIKVMAQRIQQQQQHKEFCEEGDTFYESEEGYDQFDNDADMLDLHGNVLDPSRDFINESNSNNVVPKSDHNRSLQEQGQGQGFTSHGFYPEQRQSMYLIILDKL